MRQLPWRIGNGVNDNEGENFEEQFTEQANLLFFLFVKKRIQNQLFISMQDPAHGAKTMRIHLDHDPG